MKRIAYSREHLMAIFKSKQDVKFRLEAIAFCLIVRNDYASASINNKDVDYLRTRMGIGRDKTYKIIRYLVEAELLRKVANGYWQLGKLPKHRGNSKNIFIDGSVCDFSSIKSVVEYLYAVALQTKKSQMSYMSSLKQMACGYDGSGKTIPSAKEVKTARKRLNKLDVPESSFLKNGFDADLSKHMGQSYNTIANTLGVSRAKAVCIIDSLVKSNLLTKEKKCKVVYVGADAANVLKYKFDGSVYTKFGQSFLFLSKKRNSIIANFSNSYIYTLSGLTLGSAAMYA